MTPALDAALRAFVGDGMWYKLRPRTDGPARPDPARRALYADYERKSFVWVGWVFGLMALGAGAMFRYSEVEDRARMASYRAEGLTDLVHPVSNASVWILLGGVALIVMGIALGIWRRAVRPDGLTPRADFLASALERLDLQPVQRRHAEALAAVYGGEVSDVGGEGLGLLRKLAEEEERLLALSPTIRNARAPEVAAEAEALRTRLETARDLGAREALAQGLALAEGRVEAATHADRLRERLEAHRSLLDQAAAAASEMIFGRGDVGPGLDDLRRNVASLGRDVTALESAIREMDGSELLASRVGASA